MQAHTSTEYVAASVDHGGSAGTWQATGPPDAAQAGARIKGHSRNLQVASFNGTRYDMDRNLVLRTICPSRREHSPGTAPSLAAIVWMTDWVRGASE